MGLWAFALVAPLGVVGLHGFGPAHAAAQGLPAEVVSALSLSAEQRAQVEAFAAPLRDALSSGEARRVVDARAAALETLASPSVSVAYRLELSRVLMPALTSLMQTPGAQGADALGSINAVILAGELATEQSTSLVTQALALNDRADMRYQAAMALRRTFEAAQRSAPALQPQRAADLVRAIDDRMKVERDPLVKDALIRAGLAAGELRVEGFRDASFRAIEVVARGASGALRERGATPLDDATGDAMIRAAGGVRDALTAAGQGVRIPESVGRAAAELGGDLIAHSVRAVEAQHLAPQAVESDPARRERYAQAAQLGETLVLLSGSALSPGSQVAAKNLGQSLRTATVASDATFALDARAMVGPDGALSKPPFGFERARFLPR
jgi:hypothetical protein